jgi:cell wall-associated NlpC family hydrolase
MGCKAKGIILSLMIAVTVLCMAGAALAAEPATERSSVWVNATRLNLRSAPEMTADSLGMLARGEELTVLQAGEAWTRVKSAKLGEGWVATRYLTDRRMTEVSRSIRGRADQLISLARFYMGTRYVYGASSPSGFDCSGFTMYIYRQAGYILPHSALAQSQMGIPVSRDELQTGDLVFFMTCGQTRINHVGIYIGEGQFIHASSGGGRVMISSLNEGYYRQRYVRAVRIMDYSSGERASSGSQITVADERTSG